MVKLVVNIGTPFQAVLTLQFPGFVDGERPATLIDQ
jgi:hypothetical protein